METREKNGNSSRDKPWTRCQKRLSGYQFFLRACLKELKVQYPDSSIVLSEVSKLCAETWQRLHPAVKQRFQDEADAINLANFRVTGDKKDKPRIYGPKRPLSAFILFCKENRRNVKMENPGLSMGQISTVLSSWWSLADGETKAKYQQMSKTQRERYREELLTSKKLKKGAPELDPESIKIEIGNIKQEVDIKQEIFNFEADQDMMDFTDMMNFNQGCLKTEVDGNEGDFNLQLLFPD